MILFLLFLFALCQSAFGLELQPPQMPGIEMLAYAALEYGLGKTKLVESNSLVSLLLAGFKLLLKKLLGGG